MSQDKENHKKINFLNKNFYNQIDWDKDIEGKEKIETLSKKVILNRFSDSLHTFTLVEQNIKVEECECKEGEANRARLLQYLHAKFVYYHSYFYKDFRGYEVDLSEGNERYNFFDPKLPKSHLPMKMIKEAESAFGKQVKKFFKEEEKNKPTDKEYYNQAKNLLQAEGLRVIKPKGIKKEHDRDTFCIKHDGIPYRISVMRRDEDRTKIKTKEIKVIFNEFLRRYHPLVKSLFLELKKLPGMENLWVMEGGGMQHQAFFGDENGYIGILYLGLKRSKDEMKEKDEGYNFILERKELDKSLKNIKVAGIDIVLYKDHWGKVEFK